MMRLCLLLVGVWLPLAAIADPIRLIYFRLPPFADQVNDKATG